MCGVSYPELARASSRSTARTGACPTCGGLGVQRRFDPRCIVPTSGEATPAALVAAVAARRPPRSTRLAALARHYRVARDDAVRELPDAARKALLDGTGDEDDRVPPADRAASGTVRRAFEGDPADARAPAARDRVRWLREELEGLVAEPRCPTCDGTRLRREARFVRVGGQSIAEVSRAADRARRWRSSRALGSRRGERRSPRRS